MTKADESDKEESIAFKILLLGDSEVGKTSFILRFCEGSFKTDSLTTIGLDTKTKFIKRNNKKIQLLIWDTAGEERFKAIAKNSYKGAHGILLMYAINKKNTFKAIKDWLNNLRDNTDINKIAILVVGNKTDLPKEEREVDDDMIKSLKEKENVEILEGSAKENINVNEAFILLIDKMLALGLGKVKASFNEDDDEENEKNKNIKLNNNKTQNKKGCCAGKSK